MIVPRCLAGHLNSPSSVFVGCANKLHTAVILDCTNINMYCIDMFLIPRCVFILIATPFKVLAINLMFRALCGCSASLYAAWNPPAAVSVHMTTHCGLD